MICVRLKIILYIKHETTSKKHHSHFEVYDQPIKSGRKNNRKYGCRNYWG